MTTDAGLTTRTPRRAARTPRRAGRTPRRAGGRARLRLPLIGLLAAQGLSLAGNAITMIVVPLYVLADTGSVLATGVAGAFATVPVILGGALGGVLVDRVGFRRAAIAADVASGVTVLAIPVLAATVGLPFWALLALVFLSGVLDTPGNTAKTSLVPDLAELGRLGLGRASSVQSAISRTAAMTGAALAALSVAWLGPLNSLVLDSVTFAISAALVAVFVPRRLTPADAREADEPSEASGEADEADEPGEARDSREAGGLAGPRRSEAGYWRELGDGIRFLARTRVIRNLVLMIVVTNCFDAAGLSVIFPVFARTISADGAAFGIMVALFSFGALAGAALFGWVGQHLPRRGTLVICFLLAGAPPYLTMASGAAVWAVFLVIGLAGLAAGSINPLLSTVLYERIPRTMRARVLGALTAGVSAGMPVGAFAGGLALSQVGLVPTLLAVAGLYAVVTLAPLVGRSWRELDRAAPAV